MGYIDTKWTGTFSETSEITSWKLTLVKII